MRSPLLQKANEEGLEIKIAAEKYVNAAIKSLSVTEYLDSEMAAFRNKVKEKEEIKLDIPASVDKGKENFEECIALLSEVVQQETKKTNDHLLSMKKFKVKRSIEGMHKGGRIKYVSSEFGFSYTVIVSHDWASHNFWFSMHFNYKYGDYGARKCDHARRRSKNYIKRRRK